MNDGASVIVVGWTPDQFGEVALHRGVEEARLRAGRVVVVNATRGDALVDDRFADDEQLVRLTAELAASGIEVVTRRMMEMAREWNLPRESRITPVEAAVMLGIPNLMMVRYNGLPAMPYQQVALPMRAMERVAWSLTGARGESSAEEREHVLALAAANANFSGLVLDDFIDWDTGQPELSVDELRDISARRAMPTQRAPICKRRTLRRSCMGA